MSVFSDGLWSEVHDDSGVQALVAAYDGRSAVFTDDVPEDASRPYVVLRNLSDAPFDTKGQHGRDIRREVLCVADNTGSTEVVEDLCETVRALLHDSTTLAATGYDTVIAEIESGPVPVPTDDSVYAFALTLRWRLLPS